MSESLIITPQEAEQQASQAVERVRVMCRRAFNDGVQRGYQKGFEDGVAAASGAVPAEPDKRV